MKKFAFMFGTLLSAIATTVTTTASWAIFHSEEVPEDLK